jgi:hypothetical protein
MNGDQRPKLFALIYCGSVGMTTILKWIFKKKNRIETRGQVNTATNIQFPSNIWNFLSNLATISFSKSF